MPNQTGPSMRPEVEARIDEAVDAPGRALRRRVAHDQVARRAGRADREARSRRTPARSRQRHGADRDQRKQRRAQRAARPRRRDRGARCARRGSRRRRCRPCRRAGRRLPPTSRATSGTPKPAVERRRQERLQPDRRRRLERRSRRSTAGSPAAGTAPTLPDSVCRCASAARCDVRMCRWLREHAERDQPDHAHGASATRQPNAAPSAEAHDRRERVTEVAADAVRRIRVAEPPRRRRSR